MALGRHHRLKHAAGWHVTLDPDGTVTWVDRTGHEYTTYPATYADPAGDDTPEDTDAILQALLAATRASPSPDPAGQGPPEPDLPDDPPPF